MTAPVSGEPGALTWRASEDVVAEVDGILARLATQVGDPTGAVGERLFPRAYLDPTEDAAETFWRLSRRDGLVADRLAAIAAVRADIANAVGGRRLLGRVEVPLGDGTHWMTACNDARLWIGTELGLGDEDLEAARGDLRNPEYARYVMLTMLLEGIVEAVLDEMPVEGRDDDEG